MMNILQFVFIQKMKKKKKYKNERVASFDVTVGIFPRIRKRFKFLATTKILIAMFIWEIRHSHAYGQYLRATHESFLDGCE